MRAQSLALISAAALALSACGAGDPASPAAAVAPAAGERLIVRESRVADLKPVAATVATKDMGEARARIGGTLTRLSVDEGDHVRKGQVIAVVSDQRLKLETAGYAAQVAAAEAEATRARAELQRIDTLYEKGIYARARLEQAQAAARAAEGQLNAARAQRAASAEVSGQGAVLAPASGRVLKADTPEGSVVSPGQTIVTITAGEPLLRLEIPEAQARGLKVGDTVAIVPEDLPGAAAAGTVSQIYPAVTAGKVVADIAVPGLTGERVGQRVRVRVRVGERPGLVIPRRFIATRYGVDFVRLVGPGGRASDVAVQITPASDPAQVEVLSGLAAGDVLLAERGS
jgi:RND family efflux transporter MFP subunit